MDVSHGQQFAVANIENAIAFDPRDAICYMETRNGQIVDLSQLCGGGQQRRSWAFSAIDQGFLNAYQQDLSRRLGRMPAAQQALSQAQQNPQAIVQRGQNTCDRIRGGMPPDLAALDQGGVDADVVNTLALNYYCPDLDD